MGNLHRIERDRKMPLQGTSAQELHFLHLAESSPNRKGPQDAAARNICTGTTFSASCGIFTESKGTARCRCNEHLHRNYIFCILRNLHRIERDRKMPLQGTSAQELHFLHLTESKQPHSPSIFHKSLRLQVCFC